MRGVLRADPLWVETFTGLRMKQFERLLKVVREPLAPPFGVSSASVSRVIQRLSAPPRA